MTDKMSPTAHTWQEAWKKAIAHPSVKTFEDLSKDPTVSGSRAYKWVFIGSLISSLPALLCAPFIAAIAAIAAIAVICTVIAVFIINFVARCLKGRGTYQQLIFVIAAYMAPLAIMSIVVEVMDPLSGYISLLLSLYGLVLSVIAVKAIHQIGWFKALFASLVPFFILIGGIFLAVVVPNYDAFMTSLKNRDFSQFFKVDPIVNTKFDII